MLLNKLDPQHDDRSTSFTLYILINQEAIKTSGMRLL